MLGAAFTTAATWQLMRASALIRSRSPWSMMAISPGESRLVRFVVLRSRRAGPITPGRSSDLPRRVQGRRRDGLFIALPILPETAAGHGHARNSGVLPAAGRSGRAPVAAGASAPPRTNALHIRRLGPWPGDFRSIRRARPLAGGAARTAPAD